MPTPNQAEWNARKRKPRGRKKVPMTIWLSAENKLWLIHQAALTRQSSGDVIEAWMAAARKQNETTE